MKSILPAFALLTWQVQALAWNHSSEKELKTVLRKEEYTLVAFVASEHEPSNAFLPEWDGIQDKVTAKSIDCKTWKDMCAELDVTSFPAIRLYHGSKPMVRYRGPRTTSSIKSFFMRAQQPAAARLTAKKAEGFAATDDFVFIAHLQQNNDGLLDRVSATAEAYRDRYTFGYVPDVAQQASALRCYNNIDGLQYVETKLHQIGALERFLETCTELLIPPLTRKTELKYRQTGRSLVYYFTNAASDRASYAERMKPLAKTYQEYLKFVTVDTTEYPDMSRAMGLQLDRGLVVENTHNGQMFPYRGSSGDSVAEEDVAAFITAISQGSVQPWTGTGHDNDSSPESAQAGTRSESGTNRQMRDEL